MNRRTTSMRRSAPIKPSRSHGNLVDVDDEVSTKEKKNLVKRTKSFWKFGKNASDNEILEGMSLWRHRDLVDVEEERNKQRKKINSQDRVRKPSRDKSNDSDRTINNNNKEEIEDKPKINKSKDVRHSKSFMEKQKSKQAPKMEREEYRNYKEPSNFDDQFYDDDGDGLMLKTVNRKNILQQYSNDSTGSESEAESDMISDDPYDSILIDDQKVNKNDNPFPNVAEIGKKLEKLSKSSKYSPNKDNLNNQNRNTVQEKNDINIRLERNNSFKNNEENEDIYQFHDTRHRNSFKTFRVDSQNDGEGKKEEFYNQPHKRNNETNVQDKRRSYADSNNRNDANVQDKRRIHAESNNNRNNSKERRSRPSYESIDNRRSPESKRDKYYDSANDEFSDALEEKQYLPRTKLAKTNSNNSSRSKYEQDIGLMEYGETLQKRLKNPEYNSKFEERSPHNGNMYGPWYDLWGLDSTGTSPRK